MVASILRIVKNMIHYTICRSHVAGIMKRLTPIALLFILLYSAAFCVICFMKYRTFSYYDSDLGVINQVMWNTLHGRFFYTSIFGCSLLKLHPSLIFAIFLPIYALWQSPLTLLYSQTFLLAFAGLPIFLLARKELERPSMGLLFLGLYLLYPALGYLTLGHIEEQTAALFFLSWAYYCYRTSRYALFLAMLAVALTGREEYSLLAITFGLSALLERRGCRWWLIPCLGGGAWLIIYFLFIGPASWGSAESPFSSFYAEAGGSAGNILKNAILHPLSFIGIMIRPVKLPYLVYLLAPLAFTPLLAPGVLFIISPVILLNLLATRPGVADISCKYNAPVIPFVFFAAIAGLARLRRLKGGTFNRAAVIAIFIAGIAMSWRLGPQLHLFSRSWHGLADLLPKPNFLVPAKREMVGKVTPGVPAATNFGFFAHLSNRRELAAVPWILAGQLGPLPIPYAFRADIEFALIDFGDPTTFVLYYDPVQSPERFRRFIADNRLGVVELYDQFALFRRGAPDVIPLYEHVRADESSKPLAAFEGLELKEARLEPTGQKPQRQIRFTSIWRAEKKLGEDLSAMIRITDENGKDIFPHQVRSICYHLYPTWQWQAGEAVRATHLFALPPDLPPGHYFLKTAIIDKFPRCRARACDAYTGVIDRDGWYIAGSIDL